MTLLQLRIMMFMEEKATKKLRTGSTMTPTVYNAVTRPCYEDTEAIV